MGHYFWEGIKLALNAHYRVTLVILDLGWVELDLKIQTNTIWVRDN